MAYENLRAAIMQNIKTNNQEEITGAIMQQILLQMVNELGAWNSTLSDYATTQWVQAQLNGYVSQAALSNYLPLTGGTLTGSLIVEGDVTTYSGAFIFANEDAPHSLSIDRVDADLMYDNKILATQQWVGTQLGDYLPLTGGTMTGDINMNGHAIVLRGNTEIYSYLTPDFNIVNMLFRGATQYSFDNDIAAPAFKKSGGTSSQFLKADGSVDGNAYLPVVNGVISVSSGYMDIYSATGNSTVFEAKDSQDVIFIGSPSYFFSGEVHASAFIKDNGTSDEVLCADGSVKTLTQLKAALDAL